VTPCAAFHRWPTRPVSAQVTGKNPEMTSLLPDHTTAQVFLRSEALAAGMTDRDIRALVRGGRWHRIRHGAYVDAASWSTLDDPERHGLLARAVVRQARTDVVVSHLSALPEFGAPMWGLPLEVVHLTRSDRRAGRKEAGVQQHRGLLHDEDVTERNGVTLTSATRTVLDLTTITGTEQALCATNFLLHTGETTADALADRYRSMERNPLTLKTDLVLRLADARIESVGESRTFFMCWAQGLPAPVPQWVVLDARGRAVARLDFAWPERRTWLEFDGKEKYQKFPRPGESVTDVVLREKRREEMLREVTGWRCIRITWWDLEHPGRTAARIRNILASPAT